MEILSQGSRGTGWLRQKGTWRGDGSFPAKEFQSPSLVASFCRLALLLLLCWYRCWLCPCPHSIQRETEGVSNSQFERKYQTFAAKHFGELKTFGMNNGLEVILITVGSHRWKFYRELSKESMLLSSELAAGLAPTKSVTLVAFVSLFSTVPSNCLPEKMQSHIGCIRLTFLQCAFSNVSSNGLPHIGCI